MNRWKNSDWSAGTLARAISRSSKILGAGSLRSNRVFRQIPGSILFVVALMLTCVQIASSEVKQQYGGNLRVAEELLDRMDTVRPADVAGAIPFTLDENRLTIDLTTIDPETRGQIEQAVQSLQDPANACHWILDYPYTSHQHPTAIAFESDRMIVTSTAPGAIREIAAGSCLIPRKVRPLLAFQKTQFGYEANTACLSGRPFVDSVTPAPVDAANPFLSFKLKDVDVFPVPEDRLDQVSKDPDVSLTPYSKTLLYLKIAGLAPERVQQVIGAIDPAEISRAVLNGHAEILLPAASNAKASQPFPAALIFPATDPYRLVGQRLQIQLQKAGITISTNASGNGKPVIELAAIRLEGSYDLARYQLVRKEAPPENDGSWQDAWQQMQDSGKIVPLMIHTSWVAYRKNIQQLKTNEAGGLDFADCWLIQP